MTTHSAIGRANSTGGTWRVGARVGAAPPASPTVQWGWQAQQVYAAQTAEEVAETRSVLTLALVAIGIAGAVTALVLLRQNRTLASSVAFLQRDSAINSNDLDALFGAVAPYGISMRQSTPRMQGEFWEVGPARSSSSYVGMRRG